MITLTCTKCKATLTMDAAFAGGVCRCQHCGTIQTVPPRRRVEGRPGGTTQQQSGGASATSVYPPRTGVGAPPGSGLEELGEIIASSGLSSSRLRQPHRAATSEKVAPQPARHSWIPIAAGATAALLILVAVAAWVTRNGGTEAGGAGLSVENESTAGSAAVAPATSGPNFAGMPLEGRTVIYLLDRGSATTAAFNDLKLATLASIASLGNERQFQVIFWDNGTEQAYPQAGPQPGGALAVPQARTALEEIYAFGQASIEPSLRLALSAKPDDIVIATAKGWDLGEEFSNTIRQAVEGQNVRIHTLSIGSDDFGTTLQAVARAHGGHYRAMTVSQLRALSS